MNSIEDRIRAAAQAAAETVPPDGVPPLRLPPAGRRRRWRSYGAGRWSGTGRSSGAGRAGWARRLAPVAAAVAVLVVVIAVVGIGRAMRDSAAAPGRPAAGTIAAYVDAGLIPRYYVGINSAETAATVRVTATGQRLATIAPPVAGDEIIWVNAAAGGQTFVLAEMPRPAAGTRSDAVSFYEFRLSPAGRPGALSRLPASVPSGEKLTGFALSPAADKLAIAVERGQAGQVLEVFTLATGAVRTWTAKGADNGLLGQPTFLSWTRDERTLAVTSGGTGVLLLNPDAPGGNLHLASQPGGIGSGQRWFAGTGQGWQCMATPLITGDGQTLVCGARPKSLVSVSNDQIGYAEYAATGGKLGHVLGQHLAGPVGPTLGWTNASGSILIGGVQENPDSARLVTGVITGNRFLPLPGAPDLTFMNIAW